MSGKRRTSQIGKRKYSKEMVAAFFDMRRDKKLTLAELSDRVGVNKQVLHELLNAYARGEYE